MNANDRIALELGRAQLGRIVAEEQVAQLREQITERDAIIADLRAVIEPADAATD